jgi:tetratricopeptide (TPR) repeat protein
LEEIISIREKAPFESLVKTLLDYEMLAYTMKVKILAEKKKIKEAESYIQKFVSIWPGDFSLYNLENSIAGAYRSVAIYYYYKGYKTKAKEVVAEGLKYVPNSNFLKSVVN